MTKEREALKLALEAMERFGEEGTAERYIKARTAIKEALAQPEHEPVAWIAFDDMEPPIDSALDDPEVQTPRSVLVTNNIKGKDRMGRKSHVWFAAPMKNKNGEWVAFDEATRKIESLTHWIDPFNTTPPPVTESHKRKPLTDEEIEKQVEAELTHYWNGEYIDTTGARDQLTAFARAIEAAHGIKEKNT